MKRNYFDESELAELSEVRESSIPNQKHSSGERIESLDSQVQGLLSCPWCGTSPKIIERVNADSIPIYEILCEGDCLFIPRITVRVGNKANAITAWNTRAASAEYVRGLEDAATVVDSFEVIHEEVGSSDDLKNNVLVRRVAGAIHALIPVPISHPDPSAKRRLGTSNAPDHSPASTTDKGLDQ